MLLMVSGPGQLCWEGRAAAAAACQLGTCCQPCWGASGASRGQWDREQTPCHTGSACDARQLPVKIGRQVGYGTAALPGGRRLPARTLSS